MAKKITEKEEVLDVKELNETETVETETVDNEKAKQDTDKAADKPAKTKETKVELPENIKAVLKRFPEYKELYIDNEGGVYTTTAPEYARKKATKYTNPFYNK